MMNTGKLRGMTIFITGASRGIGKAIALKAAKDGANIVIAAKTNEPHPKLPGTIYTAAKEVEEAGGKALPCVVDIRNEEEIKKAVETAVSEFGGIDIVINNASAISLTPTLLTEAKKFDLMNNVNTRGTFLVSKYCLPHLKAGKNPHILNISPPLNLNSYWFENHLAYTIAKYGMSFCVLGMHREFKEDGIAVNALWPRTAISTSAMTMLAGSEVTKYLRKPEIVADAAYAILIKDAKRVTGNFFIDDEVLQAEGITDLTPYACSPEHADSLLPDFFLDVTHSSGEKIMKQILGRNETSKDKAEEKTEEIMSENFDLQLQEIFGKVKAKMNPDIVKKVQAVVQLNIKGSKKEIWHIDLKNGKGSAGPGKPESTPDITIVLHVKDFLDIYTGRLKALNAYMEGKMKFIGKLPPLSKLERLMSLLKSKL